MKNIVEYLKDTIGLPGDSSLNESSAKHEFKFSADLGEFENCDDILKSFEDDKNVTVEDKTISFTVTDQNFNDFTSVQDILQQFYETLRKSNKRYSVEAYATLINKFGKKVEALNDFLDQAESGDWDDDKKDEEE